MRGDEIHVDYTGTSAQLPKSVNSTTSYTYSYSAFALKCVLSPDIPNNEGSFQPITVSAPLGTIINPRYPAPVSARNTTGQLLPPAIMMALAQAAPERAQAPSGSPACNFTVSGAHDGRRYATINFVNGGWGAGADSDGLASTSYPSNVSNTPIEVIESLMPIRVLRREIRRGSGGDGLRRGGDGLSFEFVFEGESPGNVSFIVTRRRKQAPGILGGAPGANNRLLRNGRPLDPTRHWVIERDDRILIQTAGGGGYGARA